MWVGLSRDLALPRYRGRSSIEVGYPTKPVVRGRQSGYVGGGAEDEEGSGRTVLT